MHALVLVTLAATCAGLYSWTADFPMAFDDEVYMVNNPLFKNASSFTYPAHFADFATLPAKLQSDPDLATNFIMRPVAYATLHLNYRLDGFNPRWYRAVNIMVHALGSMVLYALLRLLLLRSPKAAALPAGSAFFIPVTTALLFAAHPLATESVTYIVQRFTSLSALFYLLTLWVYFLSLHQASRFRQRVLRVMSVILMVLGMLTKECAFTAPLMAVVIDRVVNGAQWRTAAWRGLPLLLCLPIIPALVIVTSMAHHSGDFSLGNAINIVNSKDTPLNHWHYLVSQITVVADYLRRIVWPTGLNLDPEWPLHRSLLEVPVMKALGILAAIVISVSWLWWRRRGDLRWSLVFVFTLWFFVTVSVSSGVVPLPDLMAEHRTYLPSAGIFVLAACLLDCLRASAWLPSVARFGVVAVALGWVASLSWATCARNEVWRTTESLWADTVAKSPGKYRTWSNLGAAYSNQGKEDEAVKCFREALRIEPRFQNGRFNLSNSLLRLGRPHESLEASLQMIKIDQSASTQPQVVYTVGLGLAGVGRYDEAIKVFKDILAVMPGDVRSHRALGSVYLQISRPSLALEHLRAAEKLGASDQPLRTWIQAAEEALARESPRSVQNLPFQLRLQ